jgi:hypothetical protein
MTATPLKMSTVNAVWRDQSGSGRRELSGEDCGGEGDQRELVARGSEVRQHGEGNRKEAVLVGVLDDGDGVDRRGRPREGPEEQRRLLAANRHSGRDAVDH